MMSDSSASITLEGTSTAVLTLRHDLHQHEDFELEVLHNGNSVASWFLADNDGQRNKTAILQAANTQTVVFSRKGGNVPQVIFRELRLEPIGNYKYELGTDINFTDLGNSENYRTFGWSRTEHWGTSSIGHSSGLILSLAQIPRRDLSLKIHLSGYVFKQSPEQKIEILANKTVVGKMSLEDRNKKIVQFVIPSEVITSEGLIELSFRYLNPVRQNELGVSGDRRLQAVAMINLVVDQISDDEEPAKTSDAP
jgi:hypothetical protein